MRALIKSYLVLNDGAMCAVFGAKTIGNCIAPCREGEPPTIFDVVPDIERHEVTRRKTRKRAETLIVRTITMAEALCRGTMIDDYPDAKRLVAALNKRGRRTFQIVGLRGGKTLKPLTYPPK
jgi:hypothetical protein